MSTQSALAAAAALVALAFSMCTFERWLARRRPYELAWAVALALFAGGAGALWLGATQGWNGPTFRAFWFFGAVADVPVLALGTAYLLGGPRIGNRCALGVALGVAFALGALAVAPFVGPLPPHRLPQGSEVFGPVPRAIAGVASGGGALVVLGGALWSIRRGSGRGPRLALANGLIALGTAVLSASGLLNSVVGQMDAFSITLTLGISILFAGFLTATTGPADHGPHHSPTPTRPEAAQPARGGADAAARPGARLPRGVRRDHSGSPRGRQR